MPAISRVLTVTLRPGWVIIATSQRYAMPTLRSLSPLLSLWHAVADSVFMLRSISRRLAGRFSSFAELGLFSACRASVRYARFHVTAMKDEAMLSCR